ncbi:hypothetical protein MPTK1_3g12630 [Marchantia polymorpha subsp. ruderalis]|uniref:Tubby C-terminal domain-containing protein n=2 Tax=Marchantia polymorpha TaxID=3197 RepID=A0AAF6B046_MARPO|nr:hypothetical protein MARPO_0050s0056 [Marchantia polymorpha]BBN05380.1 hypothetical protein Mp_3g12630 [Marchantia polymorpha subsp. ruderalis]|eukprot:PTQ38595.1 hypothetical protein MARPO_0050s0056 [Marchantia polymorpha]
MATSTPDIPAPVSTSYCVPHLTEFSVESKVLTLNGGKFTAKDTQGYLLFQVQRKWPSLHSKHTVCDSMERPLVQVSKKLGEWRPTWEAIRANGDQQPVFLMKKSSLNPLNKTFDVFLGTNISMSRPDFTMKREFFSNNYTICYNDEPIAQAIWKLSFGKTSYMVIVKPGVDRAFITSLVVIIIIRIKEKKRRRGR